MIHMITTIGKQVGETSFETDRMHFIGREERLGLRKRSMKGAT